MPGNLNAVFRLDLDMDMNYTDLIEKQVYTLAGMRLYTTKSLWRFKNVERDSFFLLSLAGEDYKKRDPFKYSLMAKYNAPNGLRFRLQYFGSDDFKERPRDIFGIERFAPYRWYYNDLGKTGLRLVVAVPF